MDFLSFFVSAVISGSGGYIASRFYHTSQDDSKPPSKQISYTLVALIAFFTGLGAIFGEKFVWSSTLGIAVAIILSGILGGFINHLNDKRRISSISESAGQQESTKQAIPTPDTVYSIVMGLGAALLVPLFLSFLSSTLISEIQDGKADKLFVLIGFCLAASISAEPFIAKITAKVNEQK